MTQLTYRLYRIQLYYGDSRDLKHNYINLFEINVFFLLFKMKIHIAPSVNNYMN